MESELGLGTTVTVDFPVTASIGANIQVG